MALPVATETFSSLAQAANLSENREIHQVRFLLDEQTSLAAAGEIKTRTRPGVHGFRMLNPELLDCKVRTKIELEKAFKSMFEESMQQCDQELIPLEAHIAEMKRLLLLPDSQIEETGPDIMQRNQGFQHVLYPHPPFPLFPEYEYHPPPQNPIPYTPAYDTDAEREEARVRDRRAQRAWWRTNLAFLEIKKRILEKTRINLERVLRSELSKAMDDPSDLGVGYTNYQFLHG